MIEVLATHVLSPLGQTTADNLRAVAEGRSALRLHAGRWYLPEPFCASLLDDAADGIAGAGSAADADGVKDGDALTRFERLAAASVRAALAEAKAKGTPVDAGSERTLFVLSSTKGNVGHLDADLRVPLPEAAAAVARAVGIRTEPLVVSNACISGVAALVAAVRALRSGRWDTAVVVGADVLSEFIVSGFQSFKALSPEPCRPFDRDRTGLNLGEAAAAVILRRVPAEAVQDGAWYLVDGAVRNDANHISGPSRTGEGSYRALTAALGGVGPSRLAFVNAHGTATPYNDEMESIALTRAGLAAVPVCGLKGYFGHTLGAAGLLETVLSMAAVDGGFVPATRGHQTLGVSRPIDVSAAARPTARRAFVKLISGFGGCNAALLCVRGDEARRLPQPAVSAAFRLDECAAVRLAPTGRTELTALYRRHVGDYPKFFKMDALCRLGLVAAAMLVPCPLDDDGVALILFSRHGSLAADRRYQATLRPGDYFPSPALFVYTLPNIVTGEICIRHGWRGESSMYLTDRCDWARILEAARQAAASDPAVRHVVCGWVDAPSDEGGTADLRLYAVRREEGRQDPQTAS